MKIYGILYLAITMIISFSCSDKHKEYERLRIDLQGTWQFRLDSLDEGLNGNWQILDFSDSVNLPGTTDTNKKGILNRKTDETTFLSRVYSYVGKAWYRKTVDITEDWNGKNIELVLERTKPTIVWVDGVEVGKNDNISTSQIYDLTSHLSAGKHTLTIMVDNGQSVPPQLLSSSHAYTESTQTNWNGIIGEIYLEATNIFHIKEVITYPSAEDKSVLVKVQLSKPVENLDNSNIRLEAEAWNTGSKHKVKAMTQKLDISKDVFEFKYELGDDALLWSEFSPALYKLTVTLDGAEVYDSQTVSFGLRDFKTKGTQFTINNDTTFLRGKHDACVFPLTAHVAMDVETWRKYFKVAKEYGINHYRFHSWCPPKACFEAADIEGIYLQPELPFWGTLEKSDERLISFLTKEGINIQNEYGNYASFVMFALGNELFGDQQVMTELVNTFRNVDNRHLYAFGANNFLGYQGHVAGEDFLVTCRIGGEWSDNPFNTHVRGSFSFTDALDGGYINHTYPNSVMDFSEAITKSTVPVISHESGQFQVYPDYNEIKKYTGVLQPRNFEVFRQRLSDAGMLDQAEDFFKASGKWAVQLYKEDIEMDLRTKGFGGFQLLDLQDYPGQGSAFVGILDAFMDSKGLVMPEEWREFCSPIVPLFVTDKFCWTNNETLNGKVKIANYSRKRLNGKNIQWSLVNDKEDTLGKGSITIQSTDAGLIDIGEINVSLSSVTKAKKLTLKIEVSGADAKNTYSLWVYPEKVDIDIDIPAHIMVVDKLDNKAIANLNEGKSILWFPNRKQYEKSTVGGLFQTDYWNYRMFKTISENAKKPVSPGTLGIITNSEHPVFNDFPTDFHTNWQWFPIIKNSYPLIMDKMPAGYRPIVQVIDNVERNHKLGLIFEFRVGNGKLLVCMADINAAMDKPEAKQLYFSMINYMKSDAFKPEHSISIASLNSLFNSGVTTSKIDFLENISYK